MRNITLFFISIMLANTLFAGPGDTTEVLATNNLDLTWYGAYKDTAQFPDTSLQFRKIYMDVTVGCASGGCSDWDYTVKIEAKNADDTLAEKYELGRFITPYGGYMANSSNGYNNNWTHTLRYDVTDFEQLLRNNVELTAFYSGWSSGFSVTVNFIMIEGTPARDVIKFENVYRGSYRSDVKDTFEKYLTPPLTIPIDSITTAARLKITPSGHGFVNSQNCAEFCERDYYVKTDGVVRYTQSMWRDDCGLNPVYPQGGTWIYDRANWCPGGKAFAYDHELTPYITPGQNLNLDLDFEIIDLTVPAGETPPNYILDAQLIQYTDPNFNLDAELLDIISPSDFDDHSRQNPICRNPVIKIGNGGATTLTSLTINYGIKGASSQVYNWTGSLGFLESEIVELDNISDWNGTDHIFEVSISNPNGASDEYNDNDNMTARFDTVPVYNNVFVIETVTNNKQFENEWNLYNEAGISLQVSQLFTANTAYYDTMTLADGCYEFVLTDTDEDGLYFFANSDGYGGISFRSPYQKTEIFKEFPADFGTEIRHQFRVTELIPNPNDTITNDTTTNDTNIVDSNAVDTLGINFKQKLDLNIYPNPSKGEIQLFVKNPSSNLSINVYSVIGEVVYNSSNVHATQSFDLSAYGEGTYIVEIRNINTGEYHRERVVIMR